MIKIPGSRFNRGRLLVILLAALSVYVLLSQSASQPLRNAYMISLTPMEGFKLRFTSSDESFQEIEKFYRSESFEKAAKRAAILCYQLKVVHKTAAEVEFVTHLENTFKLLPEWLQSLFERTGCRVRHLSVTALPTIEHAPSYPLEFYRCVEYRRVIILDLDMVIAQSVDHLFDAAGPRVTYGVPEFSTATNYGLIVMTPDLKDHEEMMKIVRTADKEITCFGFKSLNGGGSFKYPLFDLWSNGCWQNWDFTQMLTTEYFRSRKRLVMLSENYNFLLNHYRVEEWTGPLELVHVFHLLNCKPFDDDVNDALFRVPAVATLCRTVMRKRVEELWKMVRFNGVATETLSPLLLSEPEFKGKFVKLGKF